MNIVVAHNFYQQGGGEDHVFEAEVKLLQSRGHNCTRFVMHNDDVDAMGKLKLAKSTIWNSESAAKLAAIVRDTRAEIVHFHNTFPLISPAAYYAARREGAAVVQTLHNFRMMCPNGFFFREGAACEDCLGKSFAWPGVLHKCYRNSRLATAATATLSTVHRIGGTWHNAIDLYIAPTGFTRDKFVAGGLPAEKIIVKPHFIDPDPGPGAGAGGYAVFVARLSNEKGIATLLEAWRMLKSPMPLKILGDGPLAGEVKRAAIEMPQIKWLGRRSLDEVLNIIGDAKLLVFPSLTYETFGRVAMEAFAKGTPVVASNHGSIADIVMPNKTGLLFEPGNAKDLSAKVELLLTDNAKLNEMRHHARRQFELLYTGEKNYQQLMNVYDRALSLTRAPSNLKAHHAAV